MNLLAASQPAIVQLLPLGYESVKQIVIDFAA